MCETFETIAKPWDVTNHSGITATENFKCLCSIFNPCVSVNENAKIVVRYAVLHRNKVHGKMNHTFVEETFACAKSKLDAPRTVNFSLFSLVDVGLQLQNEDCHRQVQGPSR